MQPHIWNCYIIVKIQSEDLVQVFSPYYIVTYYWINRLNMQLIVFQNTATCLKPLNILILNLSTKSY